MSSLISSNVLHNRDKDQSL